MWESGGEGDSRERQTEKYEKEKGDIQSVMSFILTAFQITVKFEQTKV